MAEALVPRYNAFPGIWRKFFKKNWTFFHGMFSRGVKNGRNLLTKNWKLTWTFQAENITQIPAVWVKNNAQPSSELLSKSPDHWFFAGLQICNFCVTLKPLWSVYGVQRKLYGVQKSSMECSMECIQISMECT